MKEFKIDPNLEKQAPCFRLTIFYLFYGIGLTFLALISNQPWIFVFVGLGLFLAIMYFIAGLEQYKYNKAKNAKEVLDRLAGKDEES